MDVTLSLPFGQSQSRGVAWPWRNPDELWRVSGRGRTDGVAWMQTGILIRRAREDDALELSMLAEKTFRAAFEESNSPADMEKHCAAHYGEALQLAEIRDSSRETWVVEAGHGLVAYVHLRLEAHRPPSRGDKRSIQGFTWMPPPWDRVGAPAHGAPLARAEALALPWYGSGFGNEISELWRSIENGGSTWWGQHSFAAGDDPQRDLLMRHDARLVSGATGSARARVRSTDPRRRLATAAPTRDAATQHLLPTTQPRRRSWARAPPNLYCPQSPVYSAVHF